MKQLIPLSIFVAQKYVWFSRHTVNIFTMELPLPLSNRNEICANSFKNKPNIFKTKTQRAFLSGFFSFILQIAVHSFSLFHFSSVGFPFQLFLKKPNAMINSFNFMPRFTFFSLDVGFAIVRGELNKKKDDIFLLLLPVYS